MKIGEPFFAVVDKNNHILSHEEGFIIAEDKEDIEYALYAWSIKKEINIVRVKMELCDEKTA